MGKTILKRLLTVTTGLIIAAGLVLCGGLSMKVQARDLTLVTDTSKISYGTLTADDIALLKKIFDKDYYLAEYPELAEKVGTSYDALFDHFCKYGIFEGRTCCAAFDPSAYLAAYADARDYAGQDIMKAYRHYIETGMGEGRTLTNIQGAIGSGITVTSIIDPSIVITPEVWAWSVKLGTKDYQAIIKAIAAAKAAAATVQPYKFWVTDDDTAARIHTDIAVEDYNDVEAVDPPEEVRINTNDWGLCVQTDDYNATASTTYDIGIKFDEHTDESVSFSIDYEGSDGYSLEEEFDVELNNQPR